MAVVSTLEAGRRLDERGFELLCIPHVQGSPETSVTRFHDELKEALLTIAKEAGIKGRTEDNNTKSGSINEKQSVS